MKRFIQFSFFFITLFFLGRTVCAGPTMVNGDVSGTWDLPGSPYIIADECTVPTGEILTIEPGVEVIIGEARSFNVYGQILAVGTKEDQITFKAANDDIKFARVYVRNGSSTPPISEFEYCNFQNAEIGLYLHAYALIINDYTVMQTNVTNCRFENSITGLYIRAQGVDRSQYMTPKRCHARVNPVVKECIFEGNSTGIEINTAGDGSAWYSHGTTQAIIQNNIFYSQSTAALNILAQSLNSGYPSFVNNTIVNCDKGVLIGDADYDALIQNNVFYGTSTALERVGSGSGAYFNCFFNNIVNFLGYPDNYDDIVMTNDNGTPCDLGQNIYTDPLFVTAANAHLTSDSPCIDAGATQDAPDIDIDGESRPQKNGIDIGADEFYLKELFANAGPDLTVCTQVCDGVTLDGKKSYALNSTIVGYDWELRHREDSNYDQTAAGSAPLIVNLGLGIYDVTLTVTDDDGFQAVDQMILTVKDDCDPCSIMKGDLDGDGDVDGDDLTIFSYYFGTAVIPAD